MELSSIIDVEQKALWLSVASIAFNPTAWNIVAQNGPSSFSYSYSVQA